MADIRPDEFDGEDMTGDEQWHLEKAEFDIEAKLEDYRNSDLLACLRIGYALGVADGKRHYWLERKRIPPERQRHEDYPQPTKPERVMDDGPFRGWWTSSCPVCGKSATEYTEQKVKYKIAGHIVGAHAQWGKRAQRKKDTT